MSGTHDDDQDAIRNIFRQAGREEDPATGAEPEEAPEAEAQSDEDALRDIFRQAGRSAEATPDPIPAPEAQPRGEEPPRAKPVPEDAPREAPRGWDPGGARASARSSRITLPNLSPRAYAHPADEAALSALRKLPAFDTVLRRVVGLVPERSLRYMHLASAVKASPRQYSRVYRLFEESVNILDLSELPELYLAQSPIVNAGAIGMEQPFVVLNSGTVELLDDDELRFVLGHELGHILSDHVVYKTMLVIIQRVSRHIARRIPFGELLSFGLILALLEWSRKSELSSDRAGLLAVQDPEVAYRVQMKMAGGLTGKADMNLDEFIKQAEEYEAAGDLVDGMLKLNNILGSTHPFHVVRLLELKRWVESGTYEKILRGQYPERDEDPHASVYDGIADGARSYQETYAKSKDPLAQFFRDMGQTLSETGQQVKDWFTGKDDEPPKH